MPIRRVLLLLSLSSFAGLASAAPPLALQESQLKALGVETLVVGSPGATRGHGLPARVRVPSEQMRIVAAPVAGRIEQLLVAPGSPVKRGQIVARLLSPQALALQRDALQSGSQSALQQQNLKRDEQLYREGLIAESRLQATRSAASQAAALAAERGHELAMAGIVPGRLGGPLALTAPIDGVVLEQDAEVGQQVEASTMVYRIARLSPLWLEIQVPLALAGSLTTGQPVKIAGSRTDGRIISVGRSVDGASQSVLVRAVVERGTETLHAGQLVEVEIALPAGAGQPLPASALARHAGQAYVFVQGAGADGAIRFEARPVRVLGEGGDTVLVDGLRQGERVAVKGVSGLKALLAGVGGK